MSTGLEHLLRALIGIIAVACFIYFFISDKELEKLERKTKAIARLAQWRGSPRMSVMAAYAKLAGERADAVLINLFGPTYLSKQTVGVLTLVFFASFFWTYRAQTNTEFILGHATIDFSQRVSSVIAVVAATLCVFGAVAFAVFPRLIVIPLTARRAILFVLYVLIAACLVGTLWATFLAPIEYKLPTLLSVTTALLAAFGLEGVFMLSLLLLLATRKALALMKKLNSPWLGLLIFPLPLLIITLAVLPVSQWILAAPVLKWLPGLPRSEYSSLLQLMMLLSVLFSAWLFLAMLPALSLLALFAAIPALMVIHLSMWFLLGTFILHTAKEGLLGRKYIWTLGVILTPFAVKHGFLTDTIGVIKNLFQ